MKNDHSGLPVFPVEAMGNRGSIPPEFIKNFGDAEVVLAPFVKPEDPERPFETGTIGWFKHLKQN